jgi:hypothetical protein
MWLVTGCARHVSPTAPAPGTTAYTVAGLVSKSSGDAAAGAEVTLRTVTTAAPPASARSGGAATDTMRTTRTDAQGRFSFAEVAEGDYILVARLPDHTSAATSLHVPVPGATSHSYYFALRLAPSGQLYGHATLIGAADHGGTRIGVGGTSLSTVTDSTGNYLLASVPLGTWTVVAQHPDRTDGSAYAMLLQAGDSVKVADIRLHALGMRVFGRVTDEHGVPAAFAPVTLDPALAPRALKSQTARSADGPGVTRAAAVARTATDTTRAAVTDAYGRFLFMLVAAGEHRLSATLLGHSARAVSVTVPNPVTTEDDSMYVELALQPVGTVSGRVRLENATDFSGTKLSTSSAPYPVLASTDVNGEFVAHDVPLGSSYLVAAQAGYLDGRVPYALSTAGDSVRAPDVRLLLTANLLPVARITLGSVRCDDQPVTLSPAGSDDPDGSIVSYAWSFEDDGRFDTTTVAPVTVTHIFPSGQHRVRLRVTDNRLEIGESTAELGIQSDTLFVSATTGSPSGPGTRTSPFSTITPALLAVTTACPRPIVLVAAGNYPEELHLVSQRILRGGFDPVTWSRLPGQYSIVHHLSWTPTASAVTDAVVSGVEFSAEMQLASINTIAFSATGCDTTLRFVDCRFVAADGGVGAPGSPGSPGLTGVSGGPGDANLGRGGCLTGPAPLWACGGSGGQGGYLNFNGGTGGTGETGYPGPPAGGGMPGVGGQARDVCGYRAGDGTDGQPSANGPDGPNGDAPLNYGAIWVAPGQLAWTVYAAAAGTANPDAIGGSGGGGGGGGANLCTGQSGMCGGGGGSGGFPSMQGGSGGSGGGASIAVLLDHSTPTFVDCAFVSGNGGEGGAGGTGGAGGQGGSGGEGGVYVNPSGAGGSGGRGGPGGRGGSSGGGQGGAGGPSWCVVRGTQSQPVVVGGSFAFGAGGKQGVNGVSGSGVVNGVRWPDAPAGIFGP